VQAGGTVPTPGQKKHELETNRVSEGKDGKAVYDG
jgi:hypothetical protein